MNKKWYNYFVSSDPTVAPIPETPSGVPESRVGRPSSSAAQTVAEIASSVAAEATFTSPVNDPSSFAEIYKAAEVPQPSHGYTILKIVDMLQSELIRNLPADVKRSSILLALEAAGVKIEEVIGDAVRRDRALDTYEKVLQKSLEALETRKTEENRQLEQEMERLVAEYRTRIQKNSDELGKEKERFFGWRLQKQQEEKKIADAVSYFTSENPITTGGSPSVPLSTRTSKEP